jgi:hypothetical protein
MKKTVDYPDTVVSKGMLLDLCPFVAIAMPVLMIVDPSRKLLTIIAPYAIFGGMITLFGELIFTDEDPSLNAA